MRRSITAVSTASLAVVAALTIALAVSGCGGSSSATTLSTPPPSGAPQGAGMIGDGDPSAMLGSRLALLVEDGTISASQHDSIVTALKGAMTGARTGDAEPRSGGQPPDLGAMFSSALDPLVDDGTITPSQETAVTTALSTPPAGAPSGSQ